MLIFPPASPDRASGPRTAPATIPSARPEPSARLQVGAVALVLLAFFAAVGIQLGRLAIKADAVITVANVEPVAGTISRPDIIDRNGRLLATDVEVYSLYADPQRVLDRDEGIEKLAKVLPGLDEAGLRRQFGEPGRRFVWIRRGLSPKLTQQIHDLGLPGFSFRKELQRVYPMGALAGHILGRVDADNRGIAGIERHIDDAVGTDPVHAVRPTERPPVRLSLDVGAQAGLESELLGAVERHHARGAAAVVIDVTTGEIVTAASVPRLDPANAAAINNDEVRDRLQGGTYELGSIFKMMTVAMALDRKQVGPDTLIDVRKPLTAGRFEIKDLHPAGRPLSVSEIFLLSSNVGSGMLALEAGTGEQKAFLARLGLLGPMRTEAGPVAPPQLPAHWNRIETITVSYGHGIAVAPLQFAAAAAALVNGGHLIAPTYLARPTLRARPDDAALVINGETSAAIRTLMRRNVAEPIGTGRRAEVDGYEIGGKTGTADIAGLRGYRKGGVISSFLAAYPMTAPRYVALVMLFEPKPTVESGGKVLAGVTAAPLAGRILARLGPILDR